MEFLGKRTAQLGIKNGGESPAKALAANTNYAPEPNKGSDKTNNAFAKLAASAGLVPPVTEDANKMPSVFARERNPLLLETFESCIQYRYRISRVQEMSQYLAPFVSLEKESKAKSGLGKNPLIPSGNKKQEYKALTNGTRDTAGTQKVSRAQDHKENLLLRVENELEYLECAFDFLEGYLKEESPEDLEELSQLSGISVSELQFWLDNKVDLVQTLNDIQKKL